MEPDFRSAREHVERARELLSVEASEAKALCHVLDLTIEAIMAAEFRRHDKKSATIIQLSVRSKPPYCDQ